MTVEKVLIVLGAFVAAAYVLIGIIGGLLTWFAFAWAGLLVGGGIVLFLGLRWSRRSPWLGAVLITVGAVAGALPVFWTVIPLVVAATLVVLSVIYARRAAGAAPATG